MTADMSHQAVVEAALVLLERMGLSPDAARRRSPGVLAEVPHLVDS